MDEVRIFISYAREDEARVKQLYQRLADAGFQPWLDREHIIPGMKWEPVIKKALKQSDFVLVCLSATSINKRGFLQREIKQALELAEEKLEDDVYLIPARLDDCEAPDVLSEIQWVDLFEDNGWQWLLKAIEYGLKQRGKTMPTPFSSAARTEDTALLPLPSDSGLNKGLADSPTLQRQSPQMTQLPAGIHKAAAQNPPSQETAPPPRQQENKVQPLSPVIVTPPQQEKKAPPRKPVESLPHDLNGVPLEMILVPGGSFKMGLSERFGRSNEQPQRDVTVPGFFIGKFQITQAQWEAVMGKNPSHFKGDPALPVENVSWNDAKEFCEKLARITGKAYRLPSEAEWEYACRRGPAIGWHSKNSGNKTHPVGQRLPNAFGLYDMQGNVWEWCEDVWHDNYNDAPTDGSAWLSGGVSGFRVVRGGSWYSIDNDCRPAARNYFRPDTRKYNIGFRVVVTARTS